jgi:hypothetical protein
MEITLVTIILSAILGSISGLISARLNLPIQIEQSLALKLFEKRAEIYPSLYEILSDFLKVIEFGKILPNKEILATENITSNRQTSVDDVIDFLRKIEEWDSKNAIFLTPHSARVCFRLRKKLYEIIKNDEQSIMKDLSENKKSWLYAVGQLESSIKYDIGALNIKPFPGIGGFDPVKDSNDAEETMRKIRLGESIYEKTNNNAR